MSYSIAIEQNTFYMLEYLHNESIDYSLFNEGISLQGLTGNLIYRAKSRASFNRMKKYHFLYSTGPELVSSQLRSVLERIVPEEVEFFDAKIRFENEELDGFSAINPIAKVKCCDMEKSEYDLTNFDPNYPTYMFLYMVLLDDVPEGRNIVRCQESPKTIVVSEKVKSALFDAKLKGLEFCKAIDITPKNRSVCEIIK